MPKPATLLLVAIVFTTSLPTVNCSAVDPEWRPLWPSGAPESKGQAEKDIPAIQTWAADSKKSNGCGIVVLPGGGYGGLAMGHEGREIAQWLNERGITAWVVRYRLGSKGYHHPVQLNDALRAIRFARHEAKSVGVNPQRLGLWGFSAGGHLASTAATHFDQGWQQLEDPIDKLSSRPDFLILCYPVITMQDDYTHQGSKKNLLGPNQLNQPELVQLLSNHNAVSEKTPPTFLFHTAEDKVVPVENALLFYSALRKAGVTCEMHLYQTGRHGVGLAKSDPVLSSWPARLEDWLKTNGWLTPSGT